MPDHLPRDQPALSFVQRILFDAGLALPGLWGTGESTQSVGRVADKSFLVCYNGLNCAWFSSAPLTPTERLAVLNLLLQLRSHPHPATQSPHEQTRGGLHLELIDLREHPRRSKGDRQALLEQMSEHAHRFIATFWTQPKNSSLPRSP